MAPEGIDLIDQRQEGSQISAVSISVSQEKGIPRVGFPCSPNLPVVVAESLMAWTRILASHGRSPLVSHP